MSPQERYERFLKQPDYLKVYVNGLSESNYYSVYLEGKIFSILRRDGHSWYKGGSFGCSTGYAPTSYVLIKKDNNGYWRDNGKEVHKGRIRKDCIFKLQNLLKVVEGSIESWEKI